MAHNLHIGLGSPAVLTDVLGHICPCALVRHTVTGDILKFKINNSALFNRFENDVATDACGSEAINTTEI